MSLLEKQKGETLQLMKASLDDAEKLYQWRTHPLTQSKSHNSQTFTFSEHCEWLEN